MDPGALLAARRKAQKRHAREIKAANEHRKKAVLKLVSSSVNIYLCFTRLLSGVTTLVFYARCRVLLGEQGLGSKCCAVGTGD